MKLFIAIIVFFTSLFASITDVIKTNLNKTVSIVILDKDKKPLGSGSGFYISNNGLIATNYHVIENASYVIVKDIDGKDIHEAKSIYQYEPKYDLAIININKKTSTTKLSNIKKYTIGEKIIVIGNPEGLEGTVSEGIISSQRKHEGVDLIQITAPISHGSSGGPIFNQNGEVIAISVAVLNKGQNLNFAVPIKYLHELLNKKSIDKKFNEILYYKDKDKKLLGKTPQNNILYEYYTWNDWYEEKDYKKQFEILEYLLDIGYETFAIIELNSIYENLPNFGFKADDTIKSSLKNDKKLEAVLKKAIMYEDDDYYESLAYFYSEKKDYKKMYDNLHQCINKIIQPNLKGWCYERLGKYYINTKNDIDTGISYLKKIPFEINDIHPLASASFLNKIELINQHNKLKSIYINNKKLSQFLLNKIAYIDNNYSNYTKLDLIKLTNQEYFNEIYYTTPKNIRNVLNQDVYEIDLKKLPNGLSNKAKEYLLSNLLLNIKLDLLITDINPLVKKEFLDYNKLIINYVTKLPNSSSKFEILNSKFDKKLIDAYKSIIYNGYSSYFFLTKEQQKIVIDGLKKLQDLGDNKAHLVIVKIYKIGLKSTNKHSVERDEDLAYYHLKKLLNKNYLPAIKYYISKNFQYNKDFNIDYAISLLEKQKMTQDIKSSFSELVSLKFHKDKNFDRFKNFIEKYNLDSLYGELSIEYLNKSNYVLAKEYSEKSFLTKKPTSDGFKVMSILYQYGVGGVKKDNKRALSYAYDAWKHEQSSSNQCFLADKLILNNEKILSKKIIELNLQNSKDKLCQELQHKL